MLRFVLKRISQALLTLFIISIIIFAMARFSGNPLDVMLPEWATQADYDSMSKKLGLDRPYYEQYLMFIGSVLQGDFGYTVSSMLRQSIASIFFPAMFNSFKLIAVSFPFTLLLSIPLAMAAAVHAGAFRSRLVTGITVFGQAAPSFFIGLMLIWIFSVQLKILPPARMTGPASYILPAIALNFYPLAAQVRVLRNSLLRTLGSDYIKLVRLKGASERIVLWKHALRNASLATLTQAGQQLARLVVGAVVVETVFSWPGGGRLIYQGIISRDYALIQTSVIVICAMMVLMSLIVDILYAYIDPRIRVY